VAHCRGIVGNEYFHLVIPYCACPLADLLAPNKRGPIKPKSQNPKRGIRIGIVWNIAFILVI
jgi:hypothetical protein